MVSSMAKALMIQGTGSGAGKSLMVTALCRIFSDRGIKTAPFKAQNMALNSYITKDGGEIGRAQALQAEAARIEPTVDMNPVLLKATGEASSQVIIHGKVHSIMKAKEYYEFKSTAWNAVRESYERLTKDYELIILEGAGSPAEINLLDSDIVNMKMAELARSPVILMGDIDRGGVFASLYGTVKLLGRRSRYIKAFVINKFRGDLDILKPGMEMLSRLTKRPVIGVIPYLMDIRLPEEDGLCLKTSGNAHSIGSDRIKIVIVHLSCISNFTDFDPFVFEPDVELLYSNNPIDIENADILIIPGTKNTMKDLLFLRQRGIDKSIMKAFDKGIQVIGICGGYQILGKKIYDIYGVESPHKEMDGLGLLNIVTYFKKTKVTCRTEAEVLDKRLLNDGSNSTKLKGYEIHMGVSSGEVGLFKIKRSVEDVPVLEEELDGSMNGNCWGTYLHGIFDNDLLRRAIINSARKRKGLEMIQTGINYYEIKNRAIDTLARIVVSHIDISFIERLL